MSPAEPAAPPAPRSLLLTVSAALFAPALLFLAVPSSVMLLNADEIRPGWAQFVVFGELALLPVLLCLWVFWRAPGQRRMEIAARLIALYGVNIFAWDALGYAAFGGTWQVPWVGLAEAAILAASAFGMFRLPFPTLVRLLGVLTPILIAFNGVNHALALANLEADSVDAVDRGRPAAMPRDAAAGRGGTGVGNVYHIMLDGYQSEAFAYSRDSETAIGTLPFTYYPEFSSDAPQTWLSMEVLFRGDYYDGRRSFRRWNDWTRRPRFVTQLIQQAVPVHFYPYLARCPGGTTSCKGIRDVDSRILDQDNAIVDLWFLKVIPNTVRQLLPALLDDKSEHWGYEFSITGLLGEPTFGYRDRSYVSSIHFAEFIEEEAARPATGQYVFIHVLLPHHPFAVDAACKYKKERPEWDRENPVTPYLEQVQCVNGLVVQFMERLRALGRFDDSLVIVHADHGRYTNPEPAGGLDDYLPQAETAQDVESIRRRHADSSKWDSLHVELRSSALLLVKAPGQQAPSVSGAPFQLIDIAPTVFRHFGLDESRWRGRAIQPVEGTLERNQVFFAFKTPPKGEAPKSLSVYERLNGEWTFQRRIRVKP